MLRHHLALYCGVFVLALAGPQVASAASEAAVAIGADIGKVADAGPAIIGALMDPTELANAKSDSALGVGLDLEEWDLDDNIGKPIFSAVDKGLAAKGHPEGLSGMGVDTGAVQQGLSLEGAAAPSGALNSSPVVSSVLTGVNNLMAGPTN